jgi:hypothetical protein
MKNPTNKAKAKASAKGKAKATPAPPAAPVSFKPIGSDLKLLEALEQKLGVSRSSILRMGVHLLAAKESVKATA